MYKLRKKNMATQAYLYLLCGELIRGELSHRDLAKISIDPQKRYSLFKFFKGVSQLIKI